MTFRQAELTQAFRGEYGRLCTMVAQALKQGHSEASVIQAALGRGRAVAPVYESLRRQRERVDEALKRCIRADVPDEELVKAGTDVNLLVQEEWMIDLPKFTEKP